ncbi:MAG: glycosyltransferase [Actinomycetota bacterium]|nr:glycosyltransferase [Actinomycetota bacterium]
MAFRPRSIATLEGLARPAHLDRFRRAGAAVADQLEGHTLWHVNSTSEGGGVAELLHQLLGYVAECGISCRWMVLEGDQDFFRVTKRIHNRLHGSLGDGGPLEHGEREEYLRVIKRELTPLLDLVRPGDVAVLHDPQTSGLAGRLVDAGLRVVWVCHVGVDTPTDVARSAWDFLRGEVEPAHAYVFSRRGYIWEGLARRKARVIPPCIDPTSGKNVELEPGAIDAVLGTAGVLSTFQPKKEVHLALPDLGDVTVSRRASAVEEAPAPVDAPLVVQVSRWDRLKDHVGVLHGFARHVRRDLDAHLLLVGPATSSVADDPEGAEVLAENVAAWSRLPPRQRAAVHVLSLPVEDRLENAIVVNALQRQAEVVVQKSLAEGFGLTVAEAMWKRRPVVGSRVGGIQEQIVDGRSGLLVNAVDRKALGQAVSSLIRDVGFAQAIGHAARARVRGRYLPPHFLGAHLELVQLILAER